MLTNQTRRPLNGVAGMGDWWFDDPPMVVTRSAIRRFSAPDALIFQQLHYWLKRSKNEFKDELWVYKTNAEWDEELGLMAPTVRGALDRLTQSGVVLMEQPRGFDRTKWYRIDYDHPLADRSLEAVRPYQLSQTQMAPYLQESARSIRRNPEVPSAESGGSSSTAKNTQKSTNKESAMADDVDPEVERLCTLLADLVEGNGSKRPNVTQRWRDQCRLLIHADGRTPSQVENAIRWSQAHSFWCSNVRSMPKLREQFDTMRLQAKRDLKSKAEKGNTGMTAVEQVAEEWGMINEAG